MLIRAGNSARGLQSGLSDVDQLTEGFGIAHREIGQNLAVNLDTGVGEPVDELVVGQAVGARAGIDASDPKAPHVPLPRPAIAILILKRAHDRFVGALYQPPPGSAEPLSAVENLIMAAVSCYATLDANHASLPLPWPAAARVARTLEAVRQQAPDPLIVGPRDLCHLVKGTLSARRLATSEMALHAMDPHNLAGPGHLEAPLGTAIRLHLVLGHRNSTPALQRSASLLSRLGVVGALNRLRLALW